MSRLAFYYPAVWIPFQWSLPLQQSNVVVKSKVLLSLLAAQTWMNSEQAKKIASYFGTEHHIIDLGEPNLNLLDSFAPFVDDPIADFLLLPSWALYGRVREHVKVALGGDGGDELFGGYEDYKTSLSDEKCSVSAQSGCLVQPQALLPTYQLVLGVGIESARSSVDLCNR